VVRAAPPPFIPGAPNAIRKDIVVDFSPGTLVNLNLAGSSSIQTLHSGRVALRIDGNSSCAATPTVGCVANLISGKIVLDDLAVLTISVSSGLTSETDTVSVKTPTGLMLGLQSMSNDGSGFSVPQGTRSSSLGFVTGSVLGSTFNNTPFSQPDKTAADVVVSYAILPNQIFALDGTLPISTVVGDTTLTGTLSMLATGLSPFVVAPPLANAGSDKTVTCGSSVTLDGSATIDPLGQGDIASYQWFDHTGALIAQGQTAQVSLPTGVNPVTLLVQGKTGAQTWTAVDVTVNPEAPTFSAVSPSQTVQSCSTSASAVRISVPPAQACGQNVPVTGTVISFNGAATSIPVVNGIADLPPGSGTVQFVAQTSGGTAQVTQTIVVVRPATLFAQNSVIVGNEVIVKGAIFANAGGVVQVGDGATLADVFSQSPVIVGSSVVASSIHASEVIQAPQSSLGTVDSILPPFPAFPAISPQFTGGSSVHVAAGASRSLSPGQFGSVTVGGKLTLADGDYFFTSLNVQATGAIVTSSTSETVRLFVRDSVQFDGAAKTAGGASSPLFIGYAGPQSVRLDVPFFGTVVAPNGSIQIQSTHSCADLGEFFAQNIIISDTAASPASCDPLRSGADILTDPLTCH
jgi:hypothetical protein